MDESTVSTAESLTVDYLETLKRPQLQKLCKKYGVKASGKNTEIIERLLQAVDSNGQPNPSDETSDTETDQNQVKVIQTNLEKLNISEPNGKLGDDVTMDDESKEPMENNEMTSDNNIEFENSGDICESFDERQDSSEASQVEDGKVYHEMDSSINPVDQAAIIESTKVSNELSEKASINVSTTGIPPETAFSFSSKIPSINATSAAAASVLADLETRVQLIKSLPPEQRRKYLPSPAKTSRPTTPATAATKQLHRIHAKSFKQMDSIVNHWAAYKKPKTPKPAVNNTANETKICVGTSKKRKAGSSEDDEGTPVKKVKIELTLKAKETPKRSHRKPVATRSATRSRIAQKNFTQPDKPNFTIAPVTPKKFPAKPEPSIKKATQPPIAKQIPVIKRAKEDSVAVRSSPRRTQLSASSHQQSSIHQNSSKLPTTKAVPIIKSTKYQNVKPKVDTKPPPVVKKPVEKDAFKKIESRSTTIVNNKKEKVNSVPPTISNKPTIPKPTTKPTPISASQATKSNKNPVKSITKPNPPLSLPTVEKTQPEQKPKPKHLSFDLKASLSKPLGYVPYTGKLKAIQKK